MYSGIICIKGDKSVEDFEAVHQSGAEGPGKRDRTLPEHPEERSSRSGSHLFIRGQPHAGHRPETDPGTGHARPRSQTREEDTATYS